MGAVIAGQQKRARRLILTSMVSGTFLKDRADLKQNVGTFLAFLCSSNWNEWYGAIGGAKALVLSSRSVNFHVNSKCNFPKHMSRPATNGKAKQRTTNGKAKLQIFGRK